MDELQISGRRFISSRRLAKEHGYHSDYLGQLIRGGKVVGQKVGRAWYIDAASFDAYVGKEGGSAPAPVAEPVAEVAEQKPEIVAAVVEEEPVVEAPVEIKKESTPVHVEIKNEPVHIPVQQTAVLASTLRYYADDAPLMPQPVQKHAPLFAARVSVEPFAPHEEETMPAVEAPLIAHERSATRPWKLRHSLSLATLGVVALVAAAVASSALYAQVETNGQTANATYGIDFSYPASFVESVK